MHIITSDPDEIAGEILNWMSRGVTQLEGTGKYTESEKTVLMVALTGTEISAPKRIFREVDPGVLMMISPARDTTDQTTPFAEDYSSVRESNNRSGALRARKRAGDL